MKTFMFFIHLAIVVLVVAHMNQMHAKRLRADIFAWWALGMGSAIEIAESLGGRIPANWDWGVSFISIGVLFLITLKLQPIWRPFVDRRVRAESVPKERRVREDLSMRTEEAHDRSAVERDFMKKA